jgi:DNA-binding response OmpR family regulator
VGGDTEEDSGEIRQPPFLLNTRNRTLEKSGRRIKLTQVEYAIMKLLWIIPQSSFPGRHLGFRMGEGLFWRLKIVDVNIRRLRIKIEDDPTNPTYITTLWGYGYMGLLTADYSVPDR